LASGNPAAVQRRTGEILEAVALQVALEKAHANDIAAIARLRTAVAERLTRDFGHGHWSQGGSESGVIRDMAIPGLYVVRDDAQLIATLRLAVKKPWAIDPAYFSDRKSPLYLTSMAVEPDRQRQGIGRACMLWCTGIRRSFITRCFSDSYKLQVASYKRPELPELNFELVTCNL
jgi:GNAT superfamily N-acetyltransferase